MQDCSNTGEVRYGEYVGGLIGYATDAVEMYGCSNAGSISTYHYGAGLIALAAKSAIIEKSTNTGSVIGENYPSRCDGIIAECYATATITDCTNSGVISATHAGGIAGYLSKMELRGCRNEGTISGGNSAAGVVIEGSGNIFNCNNYGNVSTNALSSYDNGAAGILNAAIGVSVVDRCVNYGKTSDAGKSRSIVYSCSKGELTVNNCRNYGTSSFFSVGICSGNLNYGVLSNASGANLSISSGSGEGATASISTGSGINLNGKSTVYCSDLRYAGTGTGYISQSTRSKENARLSR